MAIDIQQLTTGSVTGDGTFDLMMAAQLGQLKAQLTNGRITNDQYATIYPQLAMQTMAQAIQFLNTQQQALVSDQQLAVLQAQEKGFTMDFKQKFGKLMVDVWNVQRSTDEGISPNNQNKLTDINIGNAISSIAQELGIPLSDIGVAVVDITIQESTATITGKMDSDTSILRRIILTDSQSKSLVVSPNPVPDSTGKFTVTDYDISTLAAGDIFCTAEIYSETLGELTATDQTVKS